MFHLDNNSGVSAMPPLGAVQSSAPRWFTEGGGGVPASYPGAGWFNMVQAELLNLCSAYGIAPDKANLNQLKLAIDAAVSQRAPLASPAFTGVPTAPTAGQSTNNTQIATTAFVKAALAALVDSSPAALDTLNELAAALGNDPNFATTMTNALANKQAKDATLTALSGKDVAGLLSYLGLGDLPDSFGTAAAKDVGTGAEQLPDSAGVKSIVSGLALGVGQTWISTPRALDTTYTNSTGKPILIVIYLRSTQNLSAVEGVLTTGGVPITFGGGGVTTAGAHKSAMLSVVIPAGSTYILSSQTAGSGIAGWFELR